MHPQDELHQTDLAKQLQYFRMHLCCRGVRDTKSHEK